MIALFSLLKRFRKDDRGVFAVIFALIALVLIATSGAVVDFAGMQTARSRAQTALDAAALALQAKISTQTTTQIKTSAQSLLTERVADSRVTATVDTATVNIPNGTLNLQATITVPTAFIQLIGIRNITAHLQSEVTQSSNNLEVSVSLDVTGSMAGTKIDNLISATKTLINAVVKTTQTPTYSKMAIVPWSFAPNLGSYAPNVRGTPTTVTAAISTAGWMSGSALSINSVNVVSGGAVTITTTANHGLSSGDTVYIDGMTASGSNTSRVTNLNGAAYKVTPVSGNTKAFTLNGVSGSGNKTGSGGNTAKCLNTTCDVKLNGTFSAFADGDGVYVTGVNTLTNINSSGYFDTKIDGNNIYLTSSTGGGGQFVNGTGGTLTRANYGDIWYHFINAAGGTNDYQPNTCATERTTNAYTDAAPTTTKLSFNYTSGADNCVDQVVLPLTSDINALTAMANSLTAGGSTAGQLGLAWGWYMIAPNFGYLWPAASQPHAYNEDKLVKAIIFMTDGDFNTPYCNGVIANDALSGSGSSSTHISCNAPNGTSLAQSQALCNAIKAPANDTELYVVGFDLAGNTTALNFLQGCATDTSHFYQADNGTDLAAAFAKIAQNLSDLRISK